mgnify:CR=1 FL=1
MLSKDQIKLMNELRVRYGCVRADIASCPSETNQLSNDEYGHLIRTRINQEREFFSRKHNISIDEILEMEDAYNKLEDVEEYHQFLDYRTICDFNFYHKLENIVKQQVYADRGLGKHFIPELFLDGYEIQKREVKKRVRRCTKALERIVPKTTVFKYEDMKYISQYKVDHNQLEEKDKERDLIISLCEHALTQDYLNSKWKQFLNRWFFLKEYK